MKKTKQKTRVKTPVKSVHLQYQNDEKSLLLPTNCLKVGWNPRSDLGDISELELSIKTHGILTPLLVAKTEKGLEIVAGQRRFECAKRLGIVEVPVRIIEGSHQVISVIDNLCRENLSGWDTCKAIHDLLPLFDGHQARLAEAINKSESYVSQALRVVREKGNLQRVEDLPLRELFQEAGISTKERKPSGALPGGRTVDRFLQFKPRTDGKGFSLRIQLSPMTPERSRTQIIETLEQILRQLKGS